MALGKIYAALEQMFGGRVEAKAATAGQVLTKQANGTWAGAAGGGPTYNSTTDVLGGTPDFIDAIILGNSATASQNVRLEQTAANTLTLLGGDGTAQTTSIRVGATKNLEIYGGLSTSGIAGDLVLNGGASTVSTGGASYLQGGGGTSGGIAGIFGGTSSGASTAGGQAVVQGGSPSDGDGGEVLLRAQDGVGTNKNGGNVTIRPGAATGSGAPGAGQVDGRFSLAKGADVASANTLTLGADGNFFKITGTTTINGIVTLGWQAGSVIHLMFTGALTVTHASGAPGTGAAAFLLNGAANMTTAANNTLTLVYDGTNWVELARKV